MRSLATLFSSAKYPYLPTDPHQTPDLSSPGCQLTNGGGLPPSNPIGGSGAGPKGENKAIFRVFPLFHPEP